MFPHGSYLAGDVDARRASDLLTDGYDRVDPSPRDHRSNTCLVFILSDGDRSVNQSSRGVPRSTRFSSRLDHGLIGWLGDNLPYDRGIRDQINPDPPLT